MLQIGFCYRYAYSKDIFTYSSRLWYFIFEIYTKFQNILKTNICKMHIQLCKCLLANLNMLNKDFNIKSNNWHFFKHFPRLKHKLCKYIMKHYVAKWISDWTWHIAAHYPGTYIVQQHHNMIKYNMIHGRHLN